MKSNDLKQPKLRVGENTSRLKRSEANDETLSRESDRRNTKTSKHDASNMNNEKRNLDREIPEAVNKASDCPAERNDDVVSSWKRSVAIGNGPGRERNCSAENESS